MAKNIVVIGTRGVPNIMGGVETHCEELFPRMVENGYDVTIIRRSSYIKREVAMNSGVKDGVWKGVKLYDLESPRQKSFEAIIHTTKAVIIARWLGVKVVHIHAIGPAMMTPLARLLGMKVVFTHHGPDYDRDKWGYMAKMMLKLGEWMGCWFANDVIVISEVIKNIIDKKYNRTKRVHLIYNGVPKPQLCHEPEYFKELGIEDGKYILGMCRFVPEKHLHDLVSAYVKLRNDGRLPDDVKLVLAGDTDFEDDYSRVLKAQAKEAGVVLTGFVRGTKLHSLLTNAMCYSLPSSHEGLPIALLEAMSYQLPVITSAIPANLEVGLDADCYHEVGNVDALAEKLESICNRPLERVKYDMVKYNWDKIAKQVGEIYDSL